MTCRKSMAKSLGLGARGSGGLAPEAPRQPCRGSKVWVHAGFGPSRGRGSVSLQHTPKGRAFRDSARPSKATSLDS
jgi:hypothetical protein